MHNIFKFLVEVGKLKELKRKGIMFYGVEDPETTAAHSFRMSIMAWVLGEKKKLNLEKVIKLALIHDLCEVYAGDITPYDGMMPEDEEERKKFVRKWIRLPKEEKIKRQNKKFKLEKESLEKLVKDLPEELGEEISNLWHEYEKQSTPEGRFVSQIDRAENLLEAFEWFKKREDFPTRPWWEHAEEVIDDPVILEFLNEIEKAEKKVIEENNKK